MVIFGRSHLIIACVFIFTDLLIQPAYAVDYDNGLVNDVSSPLLGGAGNARIYDSPIGDTTTLNALSGAVINGIQAFDTSIVNTYNGSQITADLNANDQSVVSIFGGALINADALNNALLNISGGNFTGGGGRAIGSFDDATVNITGGGFLGTTTFTLLSNDRSTINLYDGGIDGEIRSNHDSNINIWGGTGITGVTAVEQSIVKLYGLDFSIPTIGSISLSTPFIISDDSFNGQLLTGTLSNGTPISADIFNGIVGSKIILMQAVPIPAAIWLFGSGLLGLIGITRRKKAVY